MYNPAKDSRGLPKRGKQFEAVQLNAQKRNKFNMSYNSRGSYNFGWLYPVDVEEVIPGDTWNAKRSAIVKAAPLAGFMYQKCDIYFHTWFVASRTLCSDFEAMRSPGNGNVSLSEALSYDAPTMPTFTLSQVESLLRTEGLESDITLATLSANPMCRILDEMGLPSPISYDAAGTPTLNWQKWSSNSRNKSILPLRAYYSIWFNNYRDQNNYSIAEPVTSNSVTQDELLRLCQLRPRAWEHDYFTSSLKTPQRGPAVSISLFSGGDLGDINFDSIRLTNPLNGKPILSMNTDGDVFGATRLTPNRSDGDPGYLMNDYQPSGTPWTMQNPQWDGVQTETTHGSGPLKGSIKGATMEGSSEASVITIEQLREYSILQEFLEQQARCGSRYTEFLLSHFGVVSSDARLQRPEYIGGGVMPLTVSDVVNQSNVDTGSYSGIAEATSGSLDKWSYYCEEDGYIITLMSIMPRTSYSQGSRPFWERVSTFDFCLPKFANLGEQPVPNWNIYENGIIGGQTPGDDETFGYQSRYQDYKYNYDQIHGDFRGTMSHWTLSRLFSEAPELGYDFISVITWEQMDVSSHPLYRCFQVKDPKIDHFYVDIWHDLIVERKLDEFNIPKLL